MYIGATLENWSVVYHVNSPYDAPELWGRALHGFVYGHPRIPDGKEVTTSKIVGISERKILTNSGTAYTLGKVDEKYEKLFPNALERLFNALLTNNTLAHKENKMELKIWNERKAENKRVFLKLVNWYDTNLNEVSLILVDERGEMIPCTRIFTFSVSGEKINIHACGGISGEHINIENRNGVNYAKIE